MFLGQDAEQQDNTEAALERMQKAAESMQQAGSELKANMPSAFSSIGWGTIAWFVGIYWFLIRR